MKMTKIDIQNLAVQIQRFLVTERMHIDVSLYYNNKRITNIQENGLADIEEGVSPLDYFKYANPRHILSMTFEGAFYDAINYSGVGIIRQFENLIGRYGLCYELGDAWNLSLYPENDADYDRIEYTDYTEYAEKTKTVDIHMRSDDAPAEFKEIMQTWYDLSSKQSDNGPCVLGAGIKFRYQGIQYFMSACSPWQGSLSWEQTMEKPMEMLRALGAEDIYYYPGYMD